MERRLLNMRDREDKALYKEYEPYVSVPFENESKEAFDAYEEFLSVWPYYDELKSLEDVFHHVNPDAKGTSLLEKWGEWAEKFHWYERGLVEYHQYVRSVEREEGNPKKKYKDPGEESLKRLRERMSSVGGIRFKDKDGNLVDPNDPRAIKKKELIDHYYDKWMETMDKYYLNKEFEARETPLEEFE